ncbi:hypothetical protein Taro_002308 [Colocasia esculenta]|uniref:Uncharacterized protein n=1 Tax=Colocasia esculenta TaxID=4460 RepID=A0A843TDM7_COLES|nr:hypothetical protein [Colocasia esculenta]
MGPVCLLPGFLLPVKHPAMESELKIYSDAAEFDGGRSEWKVEYLVELQIQEDSERNRLHFCLLCKPLWPLVGFPSLLFECKQVHMGFKCFYMGFKCSHLDMSKADLMCIRWITVHRCDTLQSIPYQVESYLTF